MNKERAALVHGYLTDRKGKDRPDRLTRLGIHAAAELYRHGQIDKICFATDRSLSENQVRRLKVFLKNLPEEDVIVYPEAITTRGEINTFKKMSDDNGWENLLAIGNKSHIPRVL